MRSQSWAPPPVSPSVILSKPLLEYRVIYSVLDIVQAAFGLVPVLSIARTPSLASGFNLEHKSTVLSEFSIGTMSDLFRLSGRKSTPNFRKDTPPRPMYTDYPSAHASIVNPSAEHKKIPSSSPGMPNAEDPFAKLPRSCIDIPKTPSRLIGGAASEDVKARIASTISTVKSGFEVSARPLTPLLPPTPVLTRPARSQTASDVRRRDLDVELEDSELKAAGFGPNDIPMKVLRRASFQDRDRHRDPNREIEVRNSTSIFALGNPSKSSLERMTRFNESDGQNVPARFPKSSTIDSIVQMSGNDADSLVIRPSNRHSVELNMSPEVSSLSAEDNEVVPQQSTAGHTPPRFDMFLSQSRRQMLPEQQVPHLALPPSGLGETAGELEVPFFSYASALERPETGPCATAVDSVQDSAVEGDGHSDVDMAEEVKRRPIRRAEGMSTLERLSFVKHGGRLVFRDLAGKELKQLRNSVGHHHKLSSGDLSSNDAEEALDFPGEILKPVAYQAPAKGTKLPHDEPNIQPIRQGYENRPAMMRERSLVDFGPGDPQSSSSQGLNAELSAGEVRLRRGTYQHDDSLASLTDTKRYDEVKLAREFERFKADLEAGRIDGLREKQENDKGDWETVRGSGFQSKAPTQSTINSEATESSLANMSSCDSLRTGQTHAEGPQDSLSKSSGVMTQPGKATLRHKHRLGRDEGTIHQTVVPDSESFDEEAYLGRIGFSPPTPAFAATPRGGYASRIMPFPKYQHPEPLPFEHLHPFSSSPPDINSTDAGNASPLLVPGFRPERNIFSRPDEYLEEVVGEAVPSISQHNTGSAAGNRPKFTPTDVEAKSAASNRSFDGSYSESYSTEPAASNTGFILDSTTHFPASGGTFTKTTLLGSKGNITGTPDGTGMRAVGSSEADYSTDSANMRSHRYERLAGESITEMTEFNRQLRESETSKTSEPDTPSKKMKQVKFDDDEVEQANTKKDLEPVVTTSAGFPISGPRPFSIPST